MRTGTWTVLLSTSLGLMVAAGAQAQPPGVVMTPPEAPQAAISYWTPDKMAAAKPLPVPTVVLSAGDILADQVRAQLQPQGEPGYAPGWAPGDGPQPGAHVRYTIDKSNPLFVTAQGVTAQDGTIPSNPKDGPYGPFQRWTWYGRYLTYPTSTIGRYYFRLNGGNYVCSASVIQRNTIATAGHCVSDGAGTFATNRLFCPSYNAGGINPEQGCWAGVTAVTSTQWHLSGDPDYDYACVIMDGTGTVHATPIGDQTGWLGRAWNFSPSQMEMDFGYPAASPFPGYHIITTAAPEWYTFDFYSGGQVSKFIGNDMTGGSSGGPWILGLGHRSAEWPDTDGSQATDPGSQLINGVNSHKRCRVSCISPPTATVGVFWQEMSSPPFMDTSATGESEDVFQQCFASGGT